MERSIVAYTGQTFKIPCGSGGLNASIDKDSLPSEAMVIGSKNLNLIQGVRRKRGGTAKVNSTVITNAPRIMGMFDFMKPAGTAYIVFATADGKIWKTSSSTIKTGLSLNKYVCMEQLESLLFICNGADVPSYWDGSAGSVTDMTLIPTDWAAGNFPTQMIRHGKGNSERMWAIGCPSNPYTVYASKNGDGKDFSNANVTTFNIDTGDGFGLVGAGEFLDNLFCFGRRKAYIIDDADTSVANWGYSAAPWEGGVAHNRLIAKTPNDLICMAEDGEIYSVGAAIQYGDYKKASLTQGTYLHDWIKDNLLLSYIARFHNVYDPVLRAVKFFVVRVGQTTVDTCLVFFIDRPADQAWMVHDNLNFASGYNASCSALIRVGAGDYQIYTGDYSGFIWKLEQSTKGDATSTYWSGFKTPRIDCTNGRIDKQFDRVWIFLEPQATEELTIDWWLDGVTQSSQSVIAASGVTRYSAPLGATGGNIELQIYNNTVNTDFALSQVLIDFEPLGAYASDGTTTTEGMGGG